MLELLRIQNVALIDELEIEFGGGLNVLTGETGAGKSIIIDSLNFALGERVGRDFLRTGTSRAVVEAVFSIRTEAARVVVSELGAELGIEFGEDIDDGVLIRRELGEDGKSQARINGRTVTVGMLKELSACLVDIHGQHEHQSLLAPARHITLLDRFCGGSAEMLKEKIAAAYSACRSLRAEIARLSAKPEDFQSMQELYSYQINEIESAGIKPGEEETLLERRNVLLKSKRLISSAAKALDLLYDDDGSALDKLSEALERVASAAGLDDNLQPLLERFQNAQAEVEDATRELRRYSDGLPRDASELDGIEERLDVLYKLKKKYGADLNAVLMFLDAAREKLSRLQNSDDELKRLGAEMQKTEREALLLCESMTEARKAAAKRIEGEVTASLKDLGMARAEFIAELAQKTPFGSDGADRVEFMFTANAGEPAKPLSKIASGGEMSRVMLGLKSALADFDCIETFVFDEIDAGVSGRAAQRVAEKLAALAKKRQILCITHLPQIAAAAENGFLIEKTESNPGGQAQTTTRVTPLSETGVIREIARLTSGSSITDASLAAAEELRRLSKIV